MKVQVLRSFIDKQTNVIQEVGTVIEVTDERYEEILSASDDPFVKQVSDFETPAQNDEGLLDKSVEKIKIAVTKALSHEKLKVLLKMETEGKNRKGVIEHIESLLEEDDQ
jgi:hypothetical protein